MVLSAMCNIPDWVSELRPSSDIPQNNNIGEQEVRFHVKTARAEVSEQLFSLE
jgi:hypothetical protein